MRKAGTRQTPQRNELKPPMWLAMAQLLFAAILLYVIRNPVPLESFSTYAQRNVTQVPAIIINIPLSTVAIAAPVKQKDSELQM